MTPRPKHAKFSAPGIAEGVEFTHQNVYSREVHATWSRLRIGCREREIDLILELCKGMLGPFGVLYVLLLSRLGNAPGRYQTPAPLGHDELEHLLRRFQDYFEQDGRHHLWVASTGDEGTFVFDNHNVVYAYGDLPRYECELLARGFAIGATPNPAPHMHHYHEVFDSAEQLLMTHCDWLRTDLHPDDDP